MSSQQDCVLTDRQEAVLERLAQRKAYKVIALELGISETRVKQHVRLIKDKLNANTMAELVDFHFRSEAKQPFTKGEGPKMEVPQPHGFAQGSAPDDPGEFSLSDVLNYEVEAPWGPPREPQVVPGVLDGKNAALPRLMVFVGLVFGMLAILVLALTAANVMSESLAGVKAAPAEKPA
jgi:DNA-binding CsgD family transcriptional regulator